MAPELGEGVPAFRYREVLACASAVSFVSILLTFWVWFPKDESRLLGLLALLPVLLPYAFIPLRLYGQRLRSGLTVAITMGCALVVPGIYLVRFAITWDSRWWVLGNLIVALLMQLVLIVVGVKAYIGLPRLPRAGLKVLAGPAYGFLLFALFLWLHSPVPVYISKNEHSAMKYLEASAVAAFLDAEQHGRLYPEALGSLGPNSSRACRAELNLPPDGYVFEYRGTQPSSTFQGCTRFEGFTMTARPVTFGKTGIRSFRLDSGSLSIHFTSENRPARATDPVDFATIVPLRNWISNRLPFLNLPKYPSSPILTLSTFYPVPTLASRTGSKHILPSVRESTWKIITSTLSRLALSEV